MLIASPNPSIDRTIGLERFDARHIHRARRVEARMGGGGASAARIAARLGAAAELITIVPEADASFARRCRRASRIYQMVGLWGVGFERLCPLAR